MGFTPRALRGESVVEREQEFYWLWIAATVAYGVGDIVTTLAILGYGDDLGVRESNLLVQTVFDGFGRNGIVFLKYAVFFGCLAVSLYAAEKLDWELYYAPPLILAVLGTVITIHNLRLILA
ncbi:hypothetical protein [Halosimplex sp. J119]